MEHTIEPWEVGAEKAPFYAGKTVIIGQKDGQPFILAQGNHNYDDLSAANIRRIVACVNALKGIDTNFLEGLNRDQMTIVTSEAFEYWEKKADEVIALTADRDRWKALAVEAVEALKAEGYRKWESESSLSDNSLEVIAKLQEAGE